MPLKFISAVNQSDEAVHFGAMTVLVGPNNSGKSRTLRDLRDFALGRPESALTLFKSINAAMPSKEEFLDHFHLVRTNDYPGSAQAVGIIDSLIETQASGNSVENFTQLINGTDEKSQREIFGRYLISHLHAGTRFALTSPQNAYDTRTEKPSHALQEFFFRRSAVQKDLRQAFMEAFDCDIALDWAAMGRWYFKVGNTFGGELSDSQAGLDQQLRDGQLLNEQGDGYQSFAGIVMAAILFPNRPLLLDEPEAFLHPKQARVLGQLLGRLSATRSAQILVSTHSAAFMWGVVSGNSDTNVLRLNRTGNTTRFTQVPASTVKALTSTPLLSSQPVLDALFHQGVVVCEGDPDRAVYQFVAHQALAGKGGEDLLFIHTNGKGAADVPVQLLRGAGVPVAVIVDIDILNAKTPLDKLVKSLSSVEFAMQLEQRRAEIANGVLEVPEAQVLQQLRTEVARWIDSSYADARSAKRGLESIVKSTTSKWGDVKKNGVAYFTGEQLAKVLSLIDDLAKIGIFVVPCGELEQWIDTGAAKGKDWNRRALEMLQKDGCPHGLADFMEKVIDFISGSGAAVTSTS